MPEKIQRLETQTAGEYTVAVVKQMDHASLDEIAAAVCEELDALAEKNGVSIQYEVYSGQGDQSVLTQIGTQVISEQVDAVIPIATLAAQVMATCAEDTKTPVVYAAISDPEAAEMTGIRLCDRNLRRPEHKVHPGYDAGPGSGGEKGRTPLFLIGG